ncbi:MAG: type IX secretion system outer membrane channel protein PorV [Bacteroidales bacterium]|nr:type IX secretion system outer membrane channel protein PorV [Bacteroidales bacterium]
MNKTTSLILSLIFGLSFNLKAQLTTGDLTGQDAGNPIQTAIPLLNITPDSRSGAMGDVGVATSADANALYWNIAKLPFADHSTGLAISYTPWLRNLADDIDLSYIAGYFDLDDRQTIGIGLRYFSLGNITFTNIYGNVLRDFRPKEFTLDGAYAFKMSEEFSGGIALRYIYSNLTGGIGQTESKPGQTVAGDLGFYYQKDLDMNGKDARFSSGINISNIGGKIDYTEDAQYFIPMNLRIGTSYILHLDDYNSLSFAFDINKLLVPTPPIHATDTITGDAYLIGMDDNVSVPVALIQSFYDAPGVLNSDGTRSVFKEEFREFNYSFGAEYWYAEQFAIRTGYFYEHPTKGNRKYFTLGVGLRLNVFGLDFAYLIANSQQNPLNNTLRFTLHFDFENLKKEASIE